MGHETRSIYPDLTLLFYNGVYNWKSALKLRLTEDLQQTFQEGRRGDDLLLQQQSSAHYKVSTVFWDYVTDVCGNFFCLNKEN